MTLSLATFGDNPQQPSIAAEVYVPDQLIAGALHLVTEQVTVKQSAGVTYPRGQVLAQITAAGADLGKFTLAIQTGGVSGQTIPAGVLVDVTNVNAGDVVTDVYTMGEFDLAALTYDNSFSATQLQVQATATLYFKPVSAGLTQVPEN